MNEVFTKEDLNIVGDVLGPTCSVTAKTYGEYCQEITIVQYIRGVPYTTAYSISTMHPTHKEFLAFEIVRNHTYHVAKTYFRKF